MSKFSELQTNPPKIEVKKGAREVIFTLVSVMCDNRYKYGFKKNEQGDFQALRFGYAFSTFQIEGYDEIDIVWAADEEKWQDVVKMINTGTCRVELVRSR